MTINSKFDCGQVVSFCLDKTAKGIVSKVMIEGQGILSYCVTWEDKRALWHYEFELELLATDEWSHKK